MVFLATASNGPFGEQRHRLEPTQQVVWKRVERADQDMRGHGAGDQRVAICRRPRGTADAEAPVRTSHILDNDGLTKRCPHPLGQQACNRVQRPARGERHDDRDGPRRIGLRSCDARNGREREGTRRQMQKSSAGKFHDVPFSIIVIAMRRSLAFV
jgi:hypothetical protein